MFFESIEEMKSIQKKNYKIRQDCTFSIINSDRKERIDIHHYTFNCRDNEIANKRISHRMSRKMLLDAIYKYYPKEKVDLKYVENAIYSRINDKTYIFAR